MLLNFCFVVVLFFYINITEADLIINLPNGKIRGQEATTLENKTFYIFEKIPYAAAPVEDLRFKPPQPVSNWSGVLDTLYLDKICYQVNYDYESESEDCLYVNVYTPQLPDDTNNVSLPVMFYIHGGGFVAGAGAGNGPDLFINNDVILVTFNYRLGLFGFISTQDEIIPGNNGLKDQHFALKWTHTNIHLFGGDPEKITIFGHSAGSASVGYQLLNQNNDGLFQAAILQSGSFLSPWAYQRRAREIAFTTASLINSTFETNNDSQVLLRFLLNVDAKDLDAAASKYHDMEDGPEDLEISQGFYWAPIVEVKNSDAFLTKKMYGLLKAGNVVKVPVMIGITSEENLGFNSDKNVLEEKLVAYDEHLDWTVPNDMQISNQSAKVEMGRLIRELYTGGEPWADHLGDGVRYSSDNSFTRSVIKHAELYSQFAETYFYVLSYDGEIPNGHTHYDGAENVGHGEDYAYLFCRGDGCDGSKYPESDRITRQRLIKLWTDFAKFSNPISEQSELLQNISWPKVSTGEGNFYYLDIDNDLVIRNHPKEETYSRWNELYDSLDYDNFDTY